MSTVRSWSSWGQRALSIAVAAMIGGPMAAQTTAIVGATIIDGNGGAPLSDATIVVEGKRIVALGPRASVTVPRGARVINGAGKFVTPGFIDVNEHMAGISFMEPLFPLFLHGDKDAFRKYGDAAEAAQMALKFGVTTVRDSYGPLLPLLDLRNEIARGDLVGPRLLVAGDILGWGGPHHSGGTLTPIQREWNDYFHAYAPVGLELTAMSPDEARVAISVYIDKGPDFIKIGVTTHPYAVPLNMTFSPRVLRALVEEAHKRGLKVDVHSSGAEGHLMAAEAGVDLIQHADGGIQEMTDEIVSVLREKKVICAIFGGMVAGPVWDYNNRPQAQGQGGGRGQGAGYAEAARAIWPYRDTTSRRPAGAEARPRVPQSTDRELRRRNAKKLIQGGCTIAVGSDAGPGQWLPLGGQGQIYFPDPGIGAIIAIEGLVTLGMTPGDAIVAATKHGAMAAGKLDQFGTLEIGKFADLLILSADPLADIRNIRKLETILMEGRIIDPGTLPTNPRYYRR